MTEVWGINFMKITWHYILRTLPLKQDPWKSIVFTIFRMSENVDIDNMVPRLDFIFTPFVMGMISETLVI